MLLTVVIESLATTCNTSYDQTVIGRQLLGHVLAILKILYKIALNLLGFFLNRMDCKYSSRTSSTHSNVHIYDVLHAIDIIY